MKSDMQRKRDGIIKFIRTAWPASHRNVSVLRFDEARRTISFEIALINIGVLDLDELTAVKTAFKAETFEIDLNNLDGEGWYEFHLTAVTFPWQD